MVALTFKILLRSAKDTYMFMCAILMSKKDAMMLSTCLLDLVNVSLIIIGHFSQFFLPYSLSVLSLNFKGGPILL